VIYLRASLLLGLLCSTGCATISSLLNLGFRLAPMLLLVSIEGEPVSGDAAAPPVQVRVPIPSPGNEPHQHRTTIAGKTLNVHIADFVVEAEGLTAELELSYGTEKAQRQWSERVFVPWAEMMETNAFADLRITGSVRPLLEERRRTALRHERL